MIIFSSCEMISRLERCRLNAFHECIEL